MRLFNAAIQIFSIHFGKTIAESTAFIDYKLLYSGAYEILTTFLSDSSGTGTENLDYLMNHGCWCAKLDPMNAYQELGGPDPVDELDKTCKLWVQMRLCCRLYRIVLLRFQIQSLKTRIWVFFESFSGQ